METESSSTMWNGLSRARETLRPRLEFRVMDLAQPPHPGVNANHPYGWDTHVHIFVPSHSADLCVSEPAPRRLEL